MARRSASQQDWSEPGGPPLPLQAHGLAQLKSSASLFNLLPRNAGQGYPKREAIVPREQNSASPLRTAKGGSGYEPPRDRESGPVDPSRYEPPGRRESIPAKGSRYEPPRARKPLPVEAGESLPIEHAIQERRPPPHQNRRTAAEIRRSAELPHDGRSVSEHILRGDDAADRHRTLPKRSPFPCLATFVPATNRLPARCSIRTLPHAPDTRSRRVDGSPLPRRPARQELT